MSARSLLLALPLVALAAAAQSAAPAAVGNGACQRQLVFSEGFHDLAISSHGPIGALIGMPAGKARVRWTAHTPWNGDFGSAAFADPGSVGVGAAGSSASGPFSVSAEGLAITAARDDTGHWHSGLIAGADAAGRGTVTGGGVRYGYFEARMKLPPGSGTWPAFWLMSLAPAHDPAPAVEIDVMEYYGHATDAFQTALHVWYRGKDAAQTRQKLHSNVVPDGALVGRWHDYGVAVGPSAVIWYLDHAEVWRQPMPPELTRPLYPLANLALGGGYPVRDTPSPSVLGLRYVRMWRDPPEGCASGAPLPAAPLPSGSGGGD